VFDLGTTEPITIQMPSFGQEPTTCAEIMNLAIQTSINVDWITV